MVSIENGPNIASPASSSASVRRPGTRALTGQLLRQAQGPGVRPRARRDGGGTATGTCGGRRVGRKEARRNSRGGPRRRGADKVNNLRGQAPHAPAPPGRRAIIAPLRWEKRGPARAAEGANARNRSGPIPPQATNTLERPPGIAGTGAEGARTARPAAGFQTLRQKDRGAPPQRTACAMARA